MENEKFITLAIHTYDFAAQLKQLLESNNITVQLENVDIENPSMAPGVRVRIPMQQLAHALNIVESNLTPTWQNSMLAAAGLQDKILVPIDFSSSSINTCRAAFTIASRLHLHPVLMNVFATPYYDATLSLTDSFTLDMRDAEVRRHLQNTAERNMARFTQLLDRHMADGTLPSLKYSTHVCEGIPEEAILSYARQTNPTLVVMSTRNAQKKADELLGSVAAEVLDNCRFPVFTIPDCCIEHSINASPRVAFFCNVEQQDLLAMDAFMALLPNAKLDICLIPITDKMSSKLKSRLEAFTKYFAEHYPTCTFSYEMIDTTSLRMQFADIARRDNIGLLVVPNKKKNIFARLFNPGLPHRILFEGDIPMLALPV